MRWLVVAATRTRDALLTTILVVTLGTMPALAGGPPRLFVASGSFLATGPAWSITPGDVTAAGTSGRFVVKDRTLTGFFSSGDAIGPFSFTFGTNVPLLTQSGQFHATLAIGPVAEPSIQATARGASNLQHGGVVLVVLGMNPLVVAPAVVLGVSGSWTFVDGAQGHGGITGTITAVIDPSTGHILSLAPTGLPLLDAKTRQPIGLSATDLTLSGQTP